MKKLRSFLLITLILLSAKVSYGSHAMGADISYICTGTIGGFNQYSVIITFYRDCNGIQAPNTLPIDVFSPGCFTNTVTFTSTSIIDVTPSCLGVPTACSGGGAYGIQVDSLVANILVPVGCQDVTFSWEECCRNAAITTLANAGGDELYLYTTFNNNVAGCDSSPQFDEPNVDYVCNNLPAITDASGVDPDGDSLVYSLVSCLDAATNTVSYFGPYNALNPLPTSTGVTIDPATGIITYVPNQLAVGVVCVLVESFDPVSGIKIGEVVRDIQVTILDCGPNLPCCEDPQVMIINATCTGASDGSIDATAIGTGPWSYVWTYPDGTIVNNTNINGPNGINNLDPGTYTLLTIDLGAFNCPREVDIIVEETAPVIIDAGITPVTICELESTVLGGAPTLLPAASNFTTVTYTWTSDPPIAVTYLDDPSIENPTATVPEGASSTITYYVTVNADACSDLDSMVVNIDALPLIEAGNNITVCGGSIAFIGSPAVANINYTWTASSPACLGYLNGASNATPSVTPPAGVVDQCTFYLQNLDLATNCSNNDSIIVDISDPTADAGPAFTVCEGECVIIGGNPTGGSPSSTYQWGSSSASFLLLLDDITSANPTFCAPPPGSGFAGQSIPYSVQVTDGPCSSSSTVFIDIINGAPPGVDAGIDQFVCEGTPVQIGTPPVAGNTYVWQANFPATIAALDNPNSAQPTFTAPIFGFAGDTFTYILVVDNGGCIATDEVDLFITPFDDPSFTYPSDSICANGSDMLPNAITLAGGTFSVAPAGLTVDPITGNIDILSATPGVNYTISYTTNGICPSVASFDVFIIPDDNSFFTYFFTEFCENSADPLPNINTPGGTFTSQAPLIVDPMTGLVDIASGDTGQTYTITYNSADLCPTTSTYDITIIPQADPEFGYPSDTFCLTGTNPMPTFVTTPGGFFDNDQNLPINATTGVIDITGTIFPDSVYIITYFTGGACPAQLDTPIVFVMGDDPTFTYAQTDYCVNGMDPTPNLIATPTGAFTSTPGLVIDPVSGAIDLDMSTPGGPYTITYSVNVQCAATSTFDINILPLADATFNYTQPSYCISEPDQTPVITGTPGGIFSVAPGTINIDATTGELFIGTGVVGETYTITYETPNGSCINTSSQTVTITNLDDAGFTYAPDICISNVNGEDLPISVNTLGGTFTANNGLTIDPTTGLINTGSMTGGNCYDITYTTAGVCSNNSTITVCAIVSPDPDAFADVSACDSYDLNADLGTITGVGLVNPVFVADNAGVPDPTQPIIAPITTSGIYWIYDDGIPGETCAGFEPVIVNIFQTPIIDPILPQTGCDNFDLSTVPITGTNLSGNETYYADNGAGAPDLTNPIVGPVTVTGTYWAYDETASTPNCSDAVAVTVTINTTPDIPAQGPYEACDVFDILAQAITVNNPGGNAAYYADNGAGAPDLTNPVVGPITVTSTIWIYDETVTMPNCSDAEPVTVTIFNTPIIDPYPQLEQCISFNLLAIPIFGSNITGNAAYYADNGAGGPDLTNPVVGPITTSGTFWAYDETGTVPNCTHEVPINIVINTNSVIDPYGPIIACDSYDINADIALISGTGLTNPSFVADNAGAPDPTNPITGPITTSSTVWIYDSTGTIPDCVSSEPVTITIVNTPALDPIANQEVCDSFDLLALPITGTNLTANAAYYPDLAGAPDLANPIAGAITTSGTYWAHDATITPVCADQTSFTITINVTPTIDPYGPVSGCDSYDINADLALITGTNLVNPIFVADNAGAPDPTNPIAGPITTTSIVWIYDATGTTPDCFSSEPVSISIINTPVLDPIANMEGCDNFDLLAIPITGANLTPNAAYYPDAAGAPDFANPVVGLISNSGTYWAADATNSPVCPAQTSFTITINITPNIDPYGPVSGCDSYDINADLGLITGTNLVNPIFVADNAGTPDPTNPIAAPITTTSVVWIYDATNTNPDCTDAVPVTVAITNTPSLDAIANMEGCDSFDLLAIPISGTDLSANVAYYPDAGGAPDLANPIVGLITTSGTYWAADATVSPVCADQTSFTVTINTTPSIDPYGPVSGCDSYDINADLALITGTDLVNPIFVADNAGAPDPTNPITGPITTTSIVWIYDATGTTPDCFSSEPVSVSIINTPALDPIANMEGCDNFDLLAIPITGANLTPNAAYYPDAAGAPDFANPIAGLITTSGTFWAADATNSPVCADQTSFNITINTTPNIDPYGPVSGCDSYNINGDLGLVTGTNLVSPIFVADNAGAPDPANPIAGPITTTSIVWVYDATGSNPDCTDAVPVTVNIINTPIIDALGPFAGCETFDLLGEAITGSNITANATYYNPLPGGGGPDLTAPVLGPITNSGTYWAYDETGGIPNCSAAQAVTVTIDLLTNIDPAVSYTPDQYCLNQVPDPTPDTPITPGGTYSIVPNSATINAITGAIDMSTVTAGPYTIWYQTSGGTCVDSSSTIVTILPDDDSSFTYPEISYCTAETDPNPVITGLPGGSFTISPAGSLGIDPTTGALDLSTGTVGTSYTISYLTNGACPTSSTFVVAITDIDDVTFAYPNAQYCIAEGNPLPNPTPAVSSGTYTASGGLVINPATGEITVASGTANTTYDITYTTTGACANTFTTQVTMIDADDPSFTYPNAIYCINGTNPVPDFIATVGGTFSISPSGTIAAGTGEVTVGSLTAGTMYTVTHVTAGVCQDSTTNTFTIQNLDDPGFAYPSTTYCPSSQDPAPISIVTPGGTFSTTSGLVIDPTTGVIDISSGIPPTTYTIIYTTPGCVNTGTFDITMVPLDDPSFGYDALSYCVDGNDAAPNFINTPGGTFSSTGGLTINPTTGIIDVSSGNANSTYTIQYLTGDPDCADSTTVMVTLVDTDNSSFEYDPIYCANQFTNPPVPFNVAVGGGTYTISGGAVINPITGEVDLNGIALGQYTVTYTTTGLCSSSSTFDFQVIAEPDASVSNYDICFDGGTITVSEGIPGASVFTAAGTAPITTDGIFDAAGVAPGTYFFDHSLVIGDCMDSETFTITVQPLPDASICADTTIICANTELALNYCGLVNVATFEWDFGTADYHAGSDYGPHVVLWEDPVPNDSVTINVTATSPYGCVNDTTFVVYVLGPSVNTIDDLTVEYGTDLVLNTAIIETPIDTLYGIQWTGTLPLSCDTCQSPTANITDEAFFQVTVTDSNQCVATDSVLVSMTLETNLYVPNAFSPNDDGNNDAFMIYGEGFADIDLSVYNRWGEKVFHTTDPDGFWDGTFKGKNLDPAVFVYYLQVNYLDGRSEEVQGNITLVK